VEEGQQGQGLRRQTVKGHFRCWHKADMAQRCGIWSLSADTVENLIRKKIHATWNQD
jgi:hypothetical protein